MENREKLQLMDKILRELEDLVNSETALLKKLGKLEADNLNLGDEMLERQLPEIYEHVDSAITETGALQSTYIASREKFARDNKLEEVVTATV